MQMFSHFQETISIFCALAKLICMLHSYDTSDVFFNVTGEMSRVLSWPLVIINGPVALTTVGALEPEAEELQPSQKKPLKSHDVPVGSELGMHFCSTTVMLKNIP